MEKTAVNVKGFLGAGLHCGIKDAGKEDLSLIFSVAPAKAAGVFTSNIFKAPPVELAMEKIKSGLVQAIITNSGNASAATGAQGKKDAAQMALITSRKLEIAEALVLVASTGVIGKGLPMANIERGINAIAPLLNENGIINAQQAMMTTDKFPKIAYRMATIAGNEVRLCTIAKGAGMIQPHLATLLSYTLTDVNIDSKLLKKLFQRAIGKTLNRITVDGCMSTNDTAIILANGCADNHLIKDAKGEAAGIFYDLLEDSLNDIAAMIVADGEGATKVLEVIVVGAASTADARKIAYAVGNSNLVKTAFYGCDPNLGRIIGAIGASGAKCIPQNTQVMLDDVRVFANGASVAANTEKLAKIMAQERIKITVFLDAGRGEFNLLFSDLSHEYVDINSQYCT